MLFRSLLIFLAVLVDTSLCFSPRFNFGSEKVRGVNLGGWLVLEPWITPSLFTTPGVVDEWTLCEIEGKSKATQMLTNHWNTFVSESDFEQIAAAGLNHVRIPIGYWAFDIAAGEPYITGAYAYLQKAVTWAGKHNLKVLIDLHGLPGSQNGFDNSGHRGTANWADEQSYQTRTDAIIKTLAHEFSQSKYANSVSSLAVVNEPNPFVKASILPATKNLYQNSYSSLRHPFETSSTTGNLLLVLHDALQGVNYWSGYMTKGYDGVAMDTHQYDIWTTAELEHTWNEHISTMCAIGKNIQQYSKKNLWTFVGEWSIATTDCAPNLLGVGMGSRYDGSYKGSKAVGSCDGKSKSASTFSEYYKEFMRKYYEAQVQAFELSQGWFFWTWKAENAADWTYKDGLAGGWIPQNPSDKKYPNVCNY